MVGHYRGEDRLVPLTVRRSARLQQNLAVFADLHAGIIFRPEPRCDLHIAAHPDAEQFRVASLAPLRLLAPQSIVIRQFNSPVQRLGIVACIVCGTRGSRNRKILRLQQIPQAQIHRINAHLGCRHIHHPLQNAGSLRSARPSESSSRSFVGAGRARCRTKLRNTIHPLRHHYSGSHDQPADLQVAPAISQSVRL